jgi:hypothetical protein
MEVSGQLQARLLYSRGKSPQYPLGRRVGGPPSRSGCCGVENKLCPCRESDPGGPARNLVTILTELSHFRHDVLPDYNLSNYINLHGDFARVIRNVMDVEFRQAAIHTYTHTLTRMTQLASSTRVINCLQLFHAVV